MIFHSEGQISRNSSIIISLFNCESLCVLILSQILQTLFQSHFLILLDIREHGQDRLDAGLLPDAAVHIVLRALHDHRGKGEHTDQVGDHHQAVEGIRNIPGELSFHNRTEKDYDRKNHAIAHDRFGPEQILKSLGTVVAPAKNR